MRPNRKALGIVAELAVNFALPYLAYVFLQARLGEVHALLIASVPPILWSVVEFARHRRVDALSVLVLAGIVLSLLAFLGGGSVRFLQLRENLVTGIIGLAFLVSAAAGRPLIYELALAQKRRGAGGDADQFQALRQKPRFRRTMMLMTLVWGFGLIAQTLIACLLVMTMSIAHYLLVGPFVSYGVVGALMAWSFWYGNHVRRRAVAAAALQESIDRQEASL